MIQPLHLKIIDKEDLKIFSACMQDSNFSLKECAYDPEQKKFLLCVERFCWEEVSKDEKSQSYHWVTSILEFRNVHAIKLLEIDKNDQEKLYHILSFYYEKGYLYMHLVDEAVIALEIDPLEIYLKDLEQRREVDHFPQHSTLP